MWTVHRWAGTSGQSAASACSSPAAPSMIEELRCPQAAGDQVVEHGPPRRLALAAHVARPPAAPSARRGARRAPPAARCAVALRSSRTRTDRAVQDQADDVLAGQVAPAPGLPVRLHLAPGAADHVLAHRAPEQRGQRALHPARVGAGQVGAGDQRLDLPGQPGVARQRGAAPLPRAAVLGPQPGARHGDLHRPEGAGQLPLAVAVPMARGARRPLVAPAPQRRRQLLLDQLLDEAADPLPQPGLDRVEPGLPGEQRRPGRLLAAILVHGVVSAGAPTPVMAR